MLQKKNNIERIGIGAQYIVSSFSRSYTIAPLVHTKYFSPLIISVYSLNSATDLPVDKTTSLPWLNAFSIAEENSLEVSPANVTKGTGLTWLCNHLGFGINKAIDVGDAENDIDAIATAGLGVAMANAIDKVKEIADVVLENDCDHSGCAEAIEKYLLG